MACEKDDFKVTHINDASCQSAGCRAVWGLGNQLFVYASKTAPHEDEPSGLAVDGPYIHEVQWNTEMHGSVTRKIVNETHNIFMKIQKYVKESTNGIEKSQMVKFSREYRCVVKACLMELHRASRQTTKEEESAELESQLQLFDMVELVWSLCEILFIDVQPGGIILTQLLEWLRWHFVEGDRTAREVMQHEPPHNHPQYWDAIHGFVLQGRLDEACQMLAVHPLAKSESFTSIDTLLRKMPVFTGFKGQSVGEFEMKWRHWRQECVRRVEGGEFASEPHVDTIARILCGEDEEILKVRDICESWYCMLVSRLLYQAPTTKAFDLQYHTQFCINAYGGNSALQPWDNILLAAIEFDVHQLIKEASARSGNWWFVGHLTDVLHHCGILESQTLDFGSNLREFLLLEYAGSLMSHHSLWQIGANYLDHCPQFGRAYLEFYLEKLPLETEAKAQKVITMCEQRDMQDLVKSICRQMGMKALHEKRLGSALSWALRSKNVAFVTNLAERFLGEYSESGDFSSLDLIDNLGSAMLLSSKLTFLGKYREFHKLYEEGEFQEAASLLLSLLTARLAPKRFWLTLLSDALPMLEATDVIFTADQTYELLHCLEELNITRHLNEVDMIGDRSTCTSYPPPKKTQKISQVQEESDREKLGLLKLALARNLARAVVHEGKVTA